MLYAVAYLSSLAFVAAIFLQMLQNTDELLGIKEKQPYNFSNIIIFCLCLLKFCIAKHIEPDSNKTFMHIHKPLFTAAWPYAKCTILMILLRKVMEKFKA